MKSGHRWAALSGAIFVLCATPSYGLDQGQSLAAALEELRTSGLQLVFSSSLVNPALQVTVDPGSGSPEQIARRILAPHGLALTTMREGLFVVVQDDSDKSSADPEASHPETPAHLTSSEPLVELDVYASRYEIDTHNPAAVAELTRDQIDAMPGMNQDALRVTRFLPGTASNALSARTHVRGGLEDEVAVYFDGIPLFEPFHYKDVHGLLGILDPGAVSHIDFFSGVFPARYGKRLSGVLDIEPRGWAGSNYHELGASLLYTHALSQGRLDPYPFEWLAAARRSNVHAAAERLENERIEPDFADALARVRFAVGERSNLTLGWLFLEDQLNAGLDDETERANIGYRDAMGWASWDFRPSDTLQTRTSVSLSERHTDRAGSLLGGALSQGTVDDRRRFDTFAARFEATARMASNWSIRSGLEWYDHDAHYDYSSTARFDPLFASTLGRPAELTRDIDLAISGQSYAAYASALISLSPQLDVDVGLRWDGDRYGQAFKDDQISPRVSLQYQYDPTTAFRLSWGRFAQSQRPDELQVQDGDPAFHATQKGTQAVVSLEKRLPNRALLRVEAFDKRISDPRPSYENLLDPFALLPELEVDRVRVAPDSSRVYGAELSLRWDAREAWSGWTSYTWSEATDRIGGITAPRTWNQRHSLSAGLLWTHRPWQLSGNASWHSGWRRTELQLDPLSTTAAPALDLSPRNADSWPNFLSIDVRAAWQRPLPHGVLEAYVEVANLTNHANPCCVSYELADLAARQALETDTSTWMSRFALVGVKWELP